MSDRDDTEANLRSNEAAISRVRLEVASAVGDIYVALKRLETVLEERLPELRKRSE